MSKHHKVKSHHWYDGVLKTMEHTFHSLEEAMHHVKTSGANHAKVYDANENLVHAENPPAIVSTNTYA
jgi:hypothetical protein